MKKEENNIKKTVKINYLVAYVYRERRASVVQILTILCIKTLGEFHKGHSGLTDKFISNFITVIVTIQQNSSNLCSVKPLCQSLGCQTLCHARPSDCQQNDSKMIGT